MPTASPNGFPPAVSIRQQPLNAPDHPRSLEWSSGKLLNRPLISSPTAVEQGASVTHLSASPLPSVAVAQPSPARTPPSPVTPPAIVTESTGTDDEDDTGDQPVSDRTRTDGRHGGRRNVIGTEYVRHTDAGVVASPGLPPSYNELQR